MTIVIRENIPDGANLDYENNRIFQYCFFLATLKTKKSKNWINSMTGQKVVPFKMNFIVWKASRDARVAKMGIAIKSTCCCCRISTFESTDHLFCRGKKFMLKMSGKSFVVQLEFLSRTYLSGNT